MITRRNRFNKNDFLYLCFSGLEEAMTRANNESISVPFGVGICGHVAETKETVYIKDAYEVRIHRKKM